MVPACCHGSQAEEMLEILTFSDLCDQECPCVEKVQDSSLLPVNVERKITLLGQHLHLFQVVKNRHIFLSSVNTGKYSV